MDFATSPARRGRPGAFFLSQFHLHRRARCADGERHQKYRQFHDLAHRRRRDTLDNTGPARIVTCSKNIYVRNFTLGQDNADLIVRLRTRAGGDNGTCPEWRVPNIFRDRDPHSLLITYDGNVLRVYQDTPVRMWRVRTPAGIFAPPPDPRAGLSHHVDHRHRQPPAGHIVLHGLSPADRAGPRHDSGQRRGAADVNEFVRR